MTEGEIRAEWVRRLRDPEAKQAQGALCRVEPVPPHPEADASDEVEAPVGECCLGVLCRIAVDEGIIPQPIKAEGRAVLQFGEGDDCSCSVLPIKVQQWAGLKSCDGEHYCEGNSGTLAEKNDRGRTFGQIADIIEDGNTVGLFVR